MRTARAIQPLSQRPPVVSSMKGMANSWEKRGKANGARPR